MATGVQDLMLQHSHVSDRLPSGPAASFHLFPILRKLGSRLLRPRGALAVLLVVLTLEVCARVDNYVSYGMPFFGSDSIDSLYTTDRLGKCGLPNARYRKWKLNSLGYRGPELHPGRQRIICIGASETFGLYEDEGQEYPRQLERELNRRAGHEAF